MLLHRGPDSYVTFHNITPEQKFQDLCSIRVEELRDRVSQFQQHLQRDAFYSINGFYRAENWGENQLLPGLPRVYRNRRALRYLNACYCDLDCHALGLNLWDVEIEIRRRQETGVIPPVSFLGRSGRGLWLFWLLHDPQDNKLPSRAFPETIALHARIQRVLLERLADLGADSKSMEPARITRIPGSCNTKSSETVTYQLQRDEKGQCASYVLEALAAFFPSLSSGRRSPPKRAPQTVAGSQRAQKQKAARARWDHCLRDFQKLRKLRAGFREGCRNRAAMYYAFLLRRTGMNPQDIAMEVYQLAWECHPMLSTGEAENCIRSGVSMKTLTEHGSLSNQRLSDDLKITPYEAQELAKLPMATCYQPAAETPVEVSTPLRRVLPGERQANIEELLQSYGGYVPPVRQMTQLLRERGIAVSTSTVQNDYEQLRVLPSRRQGLRRSTPSSLENAPVVVR